MKIQTFAGICTALGAPLHDLDRSWCALAPRKKLAIFALWQDKFEGLRYPILYHGDTGQGASPDSAEIAEAVAYCLEHPDTEMLGVLCGARQLMRSVRTPEWVDWHDLLALRIELDPQGNTWARVTGRRPTIRPGGPETDLA